MLSTRRLFRASKLICDLRIVEGTNRCQFHVYSVNADVRQRFEAQRRRQTPLAFGVVNFASTDAAVGGSSTTSQASPYSDADLKVLTELGIISPPEAPKTIPLQNDLNENSNNLISNESWVEAAASEEVQGQIYSTVDTIEAPNLESLASEDVRASHFVEGPSLGPTSEPQISVPVEDLNHADTEEFLAFDSKPSEVFHEPSIFESSLIPEVRASPLDGSFEVIPEVIPTVPSDVASITEKVQELIPPDVATPVAEAVGRFGGEPAFSSVGLGGWGPVGLVQYTLEFFHVTLDLPWWAAIALGTLILRTLVFPLVIMSQRNAAKMNNHLPEMQAIQLKMSDARQRGDKLDAAKYANELMEFMKEKGLNPLKNMAVPLAQAPFFISMFMGIRGMANLPVESFHQGGLWWFTDLTVADQFYLLPIITSVTLAVTVEVGTDMAKLNSSNMGMAKYILRAMPIIIFPFTVNFPAGVLVYWCSTNFISLAQVAILKIPAVRDYFKIDRLIKYDKKQLPMQDKGFVGGMKESWTNMKITRELEERERLDKANFLRAGRGAIKKTYKFDPTQPRPPRNLSSIQAKKRD